MGAVLPRRSKRAPHVLLGCKYDQSCCLWLRNLCAPVVRDAIAFCGEYALYACCVAIILQMGALK